MANIRRLQINDSVHVDWEGWVFDGQIRSVGAVVITVRVLTLPKQNGTPTRQMPTLGDEVQATAGGVHPLHDDLHGTDTIAVEIGDTIEYEVDNQTFFGRVYFLGEAYVYAQASRRDHAVAGSAILSVIPPISPTDDPAASRQFWRSPEPDWDGSPEVSIVEPEEIIIVACSHSFINMARTEQNLRSWL